MPFKIALKSLSISLYEREVSNIPLVRPHHSLTLFLLSVQAEGEKRQPPASPLGERRSGEILTSTSKSI
jgi:hypothetical protein